MLFFFSCAVCVSLRLRIVVLLCMCSVSRVCFCNCVFLLFCVYVWTLYSTVSLCYCIWTPVSLCRAAFALYYTAHDFQMQLVVEDNIFKRNMHVDRAKKPHSRLCLPGGRRSRRCKTCCQRHRHRHRIGGSSAGYRRRRAIATHVATRGTIPTR